MQVNGLNSSEYYWKSQLQKSQLNDSTGMTAVSQGSSLTTPDFQSMMDSYINSEGNQNSQEIPESSSIYSEMKPTAASFNMMPLLMQIPFSQMENMSVMDNSDLQGAVSA